MKTEDLAWAAGIVDGEACIYISRSTPLKRKTPHHYAGIALEMTHRPTLEKFCSIVGIGTVKLKGKPRKNRKPIWIWWACGPVRTNAVLLLLQPYIFTKSDQAATALEFVSLPKTKSRIAGLDPDILAERERLFIKMKYLKAVS